jgi:hypothetical protein
MPTEDQHPGGTGKDSRHPGETGEDRTAFPLSLVFLCFCKIARWVRDKYMKDDEVVKITVGIDCGNAPKKIFLKQVCIAFFEDDTHFLLDSVSDEITLQIVGSKQFQGKQEFAKALVQMKNDQVSELIINGILTHEREGAVRGTIKMENGRIFSFCDVYKFSSSKGDKINSITYDVIEEV